MKSKTKKYLSSPIITLEQQGYARAAESFDGTEATLFSDTRHSEMSVSSMANSRSNSAEWSSSFLSQISTSHKLTGLSVKSMDFGPCHEPVKMEEADEIMFRQDPAWTKSLKYAMHVSSVPCTPDMADSTSSKIPPKLESFESELEKTVQWMNSPAPSPKKNYDRQDTSIPYVVSERSKKFEGFLPTFTPFFLGDIIQDDELDTVLRELILEAEKDEEKDRTLETTQVSFVEVTDAELSTHTESSLTSNSSVKKQKKRRKKLKTTTKKGSSMEEFWLTVPWNDKKRDLGLDIILELSLEFHFEFSDSFSYFEDGDSLEIHQAFQLRRPSKAQSMDLLLIEKKLEQYSIQDCGKMALSRTCPDVLIEKSNELMTDELLQLLNTQTMDCLYLCVGLETNVLSKFMGQLARYDYSILSVQHHSQFNHETAKLLTNCHGLTKGWQERAETLLHSRNKHVFLCLQIQSKALEFLEQGQYLYAHHPHDILDWLTFFFNSCAKNHIVSHLKSRTDENILCLVRWSLFSQLGRILVKAQSEGFLITAMKTIRLSESSVFSLVNQFEEQNLPPTLKKRLLRFMSVGPMIVLWFKQKDGISKWLTLLESVYEDSEYDIPFYTDGLLSSCNPAMSLEWAKILCPEGPTVNYSYSILNNSPCRIQSKLSCIPFSTLKRHSSMFKSNYPKNVYPMSLLLASADRHVESNLENWGTIMEKILTLKTRHHSVRLEKCFLLNILEQDAIAILEDVKSNNTNSVYELTRGPCLYLRFSADIDWKKVESVHLSSYSCIYISNYLDCLQNI